MKHICIMECYIAVGGGKLCIDAKPRITQRYNAEQKKLDSEKDMLYDSFL